MKVLIATKNPGKIEGARKALMRYFDDVDLQGISVESNVPDQPLNDDVYIGAGNRITNLKKYAKENGIEADLYLSIESGINNFFGSWMITSVAMVEDNKENKGQGTGPSFPLPEKYVQNVIDKGLGQVMSKILEKDENLHNRGGGIQLLTHDAISRIDVNEIAFIMALTKFVNGDVWR